MTRNSHHPFLLDFAAGEPLRIDLDLPRSHVNVRQLLPAIFQVAEAVHLRSIQELEAVGKLIACGPNCATCCHQLVPISEHEAAYLANTVRTLPTTQRSRVIRRFTQAIDTLVRDGLMDELTRAHTDNETDHDTILRLKQRYWRLRIPCPFLERGNCSIHPARPLTCRQYLVTSESAHCYSIYTGSGTEQVLHPIDLSSTLAAFSGHGLDRTRSLPLVFSLLAEKGIKSRALPTLPAPVMMGRFLNTAATCFSR